MHLPCHSAIPALVLFDPCLLGLFWACYMLFFHLIPVAQYYYQASIHTILGFLNPFHCLHASSAHFFLFGPPRPILILHFHGYFANSFGFLQPNYHIFYFWGLWAFHQPLTHLLHYFKLSLAHSCFPFHIMLMGLLLSLGSFRPTCFL